MDISGSMHGRSTSVGSEPPGSALATMLLRSLGVLAVLAVPLVSGLGPVAGTPVGEVQQQATDRGEALWEAAYSERYPGCVPAVLWPAGENPVAVVTRTPDGRIDRVALDPQRRPVRPVPAGARTIGACR